MSEDTRCGKNCCFVKSGFCEDDTGCPNYTETIWEDISNGKIKTVRDCAPKRTMIEQQRLINSMTGLQNAFETLSNRLNSVENSLSHIINESKIFFAEIEEGRIKAIPYNEE